MLVKCSENDSIIELPLKDLNVSTVIHFCDHSRDYFIYFVISTISSVIIFVIVIKTIKKMVSKMLIL